MLKAIAFVLAISTLASCASVTVHKCTNGRVGVEAAAAYAAGHWPDAKDDAENLLVSCKSQDVVETSISSCGMANAKNPTSCAIHKAVPGRAARIDVSHDEDAAISTCHELQHLRDTVWNTPGGCQSHDIACFYDAEQVQRCNQAVFDFRGQ